MSTVIKMRDLYKRVLSVFELPSLTTDLLGKIMAGSEKADDYEEILKYDKFFTSLICNLASANMKESAVSSLSHGVVVVGQQHIRNMVLGHQVARAFAPFADNEFKDLETSEKNAKYAIKAEEFAKKCNNEYTGIAFTAGYIFDIFNGWLLKEPALAEKYSPLLETIWKHGLRTASLAWALATHERVYISLRKIVFASALIHDIGKMGLAIFAPDEYYKCLEKMKSERDLNISDDAFEAIVEKEFFDLTHQEIGSAIIFHSKLLRELEMGLDFHHDSILLKTRNPESFLEAAVINIADRMAWLTERKASFSMEELREIVEPHAAHFPLKAHDVMDLYAMLRGKGLLAT